MNTTGNPPSFRARLEPSIGGGTIFLAGDLDGYELDNLKLAAMNGIGAVSIDVDGGGELRRQVREYLADLSLRGVRVEVTGR